MFNAMWIALSTYSSLPAPQTGWNDSHMRRAILFLPFVGVFIGAALYTCRWCGLAVGAEAVVFAAVATVLPLLITGGIHMDGFMDTSDALKSLQSKERKLEIMRDPNTGAFAVVWCAAYLLMCFGLYHALYRKESVKIVCIGFVLSRALCALSALTLPNARKDGFLSAFTTRARTRFAAITMGLLAALCAAGMVYLCLWPGLCAVLIVTFVFIWYRRMVKKQFGGATGDTSGFLLQICELCVLFGTWIGGFL